MPLPTVLTETWNGLLDLLYPPVCLVCGEAGVAPLCPSCRASFSPVPPPICARCGIGAAAALCHECAAGAPRYFATARAAGQFGDALRQAILALKYHERQSLASPLGLYLAEYLRTAPFAPSSIDLMVPVPLHPSRLRERGFNQSALIARVAASVLDLPVAEQVLRRVRRTRPQSELHRDQRAGNVRDAFAVSPHAPVAGRVVLLIDDVITTCHTVDECARVLVNAGAKAVHVASVARGG